MFNKQKKYFKQKLEAVERTIWDLEFKRFKTKEIREEVRAEYDGTKSKIEVLKGRIALEKTKPSMPKGDAARLDDDLTKMQKDVERYEKQMKEMDIDINGAPKSQEFPDGASGMNQQLDSLRELKLMIKDYIKSL